MKNLKFNRLLVMSDTLKAGNQFQFQNKLNLIKATDNSVGKSTLVKLIFWTLGCDPYFDSTWNNFDCKAKLHFSIDTIDYNVYRYKNQIKFQTEDEEVVEYDKISGDYSLMLNQLLDFKVLLPNKKTNELESPPPAYYFTPYYIDQKKSWSEAWNNFERLAQYASWKSSVIGFHIGTLPPEYFTIQEEIYGNKNQLSELDEELNKLDTATEIINSYAPETNSTIIESKFMEMTSEIKETLSSLAQDQEELLDKITIYQGDKSYLSQQIQISKNIINQLEKDYQFAVENVDFDTFECPLCGVEHENSVVNRSSILTDKQNAEEQLLNLESENQKLETKIDKSNKKLADARIAIRTLNEKYQINVNDDKNVYTNIIETIASNSLRDKIRESRDVKIIKEKELKKDNRVLRRQQKELDTEERRETLDTFFNSQFSKYVKSLDAESVNISNINKPSDHAKIVKEGGAADGNRAVLGYYITIFRMIQEFGSEVVSPFVIDTPNQNEQSLDNYDKVIKLIGTELSNSQIFLCAMENDQIASLETDANIIELTKDKILLKEKYKLVKDQM
jgi:hypothetical protein